MALTVLRAMAAPPWPSPADAAPAKAAVDPTWMVQGQTLITALEAEREPDVRRTGLTVYQAVQNDTPWLAALLRDLARSLDRPVAVNLYLARGGGFPRHWDAHDSVILQLAGARAWSLEPRQGPLRRDPAETPAPAVEGNTRAFTLYAGEAVRFPAGWWHQGGDAGSDSAHLTFALGPFGASQWLRWMTERPATAFRPAFPWTVQDGGPGGVTLTWPDGGMALEGAIGEAARRISQGAVAPNDEADSLEGLAGLAGLGLVRPAGWLAEGDADT